MKVKCIVSCLNVWAKIKNARGTSHNPALIGNWPTCSHTSQPYQSSEWFLISLFQLVCGTWDSMVTREVSLEKNVDLKCIQANILKSVTRMTIRGGVIRTD